VLLYNKEDEVEAWWRIETEGDVEDAFVLPGADEDRVYYVVQRSVNGESVRYLEKFALRSETSGRPDARLSDSHIIDTKLNDRTIRNLSHLEGKSVVAWGWDDNGTAGVDLGTYTVKHGSIDLPAGTSFDKVCVGLAYDCDFTSAKLAYAGDQGTAVNQKKRIDHIGLILYDTHYQGLQYGQCALGDRSPVTITIASPAVVTDAEHGFSVNQPIRFASTGRLPKGLVRGRTYYVATPVTTNTYRLASTPNGPAINTSGPQTGKHTRIQVTLDNLPQVSAGATIAAGTVHPEFDEPMIELPGEWDTDSRLYLKASSPRPCTVAAAVIGVQTHG